MTVVLALHGFTGAPSGFDACFASASRVLAPALGGHLEAPAPESFDAEARRLLALTDEMPERLVLVGYSLGGRLALRLIGLAPKRFAACIAIGAHLGLRDEASRAERIVSDARWSSLLRDRGVEAFATEWEAQALFASQAMVEPARLAERRRARRLHDSLSLAQSLDALSLGRMPDLRCGIATYEGPLRFVVGEHDSKFVAFAAEGAALGRRSKATIVSGVGHDVLLERPDAVDAMLQEVLGELG